MRLISVVMGEESSEIRNNDTIKLLNYGFNGYKLNNVLTKNKSLGKIKVNKGIKETTNIYLENDINIINKSADIQEKYSYDIKLKTITAPIKKNTIVGTLILKDSANNTITEENIVIKESINKSNLFDYIKYNLKILLVGSNKKVKTS